MHLTFGMYLDGSRWSDKQASMGELQLGPKGMQDLLATRFGLGGPVVNSAERINQYLKRLEACDDKGMWFHSSLSADAWSTAKQMLAWRDELIEAGWEGQQFESGSTGLRALAKVERVDMPLALGREDRLRQILRELKQARSVAIERISLQEPIELLPPVWQKIFNQLRRLDVKIELVAMVAHEPRSSNLASIQTVMTGEVDTEPISANDDSLVLIKAVDEWEAAESLAIWLAADDGANSEVTIVCGTDTDVLDQALSRYGLPQLGCAQSSRWRASLQVLPLVLANAWKPVDIKRLVELLSLSMAPISWNAARKLLRALSKEPGVGGEAWNEALQFIADDCLEVGSKPGKARTDAEIFKFIGELDEYLATDRYFPDSGIPEDKLRQRCQWVIDWLGRQAERDPILKDAVSHAQVMQKLSAGKGKIPRITLERMHDSVIGVGSSTPDTFEQAADWQVVDHPGQITKPTGTVVWWGFIDPLAEIPVFWSESERNSLRSFGLEMDDPIIYRSREARAWKAGLMQAEDHALMFCPGQINGEIVYHHPFWDEIHNAALKAQSDMEEDEVIAFLTREEKDLHNEDRWQLAGRATLLQKAKKTEQMPLETEYAIPGDTVALPKSLSFTQMSTMLSCPMKWALQYHAGLRVADTLSVPTGNQMIGSLCHRIIEKLYQEPVRAWTPDKAEAEALSLYDSLVVPMASELLLDGKELEHKRTRAAIGDAVKHLVDAIARLGLVVEKSEERLKGDMNGIPFSGFADLVLRDSEGNPFVLDLKWSGSSRYKKDEIAEGTALQLAAYAWMIQSTGSGSWANSGYFMLAQGELLSDSLLLGDEALVSEYSLEKIWEKGAESWNQCFQTLRNGRLDASGMHELRICQEEGLRLDQARLKVKSEHEERGLLYQRPVCGFCDFSVLCGLRRGSA